MWSKPSYRYLIALKQPCGPNLPSYQPAYLNVLYVFILRGEKPEYTENTFKPQE